MMTKKMGAASGETAVSMSCWAIHLRVAILVSFGGFCGLALAMVLIVMPLLGIYGGTVRRVRQAGMRKATLPQ